MNGKQDGKQENAMQWLKIAAWVQAIAIAVLAFVVLRSNDVPLAPADSAAQPRANAARASALPAVPAAPAPAPGEAAAATGGSPDEASGGATSRVSAAVRENATPGASAAKPPEGTVLFGRFVDAGGEPVRDGHAWLTREGESKPFATLSAQSRPEFAVGGLAPGRVQLRTRATGFRELQDTIEIPADVPRLRHDIVLQKSWNLLVRILTPDGRPIHEALQEAGKARPSLWQIEVGALATPWQPGGDFPPTGLREADYGVGRWRSATGIGAMRDGPKIGKDCAGVLELDTQQPLWVSAVLRHRVLASSAIEPGQAEVSLTVSLEQLFQSLGTIRVRVVDSTGAPVTDARVAFNDQQSGGMGAAVDAEGRIEVRDLRPGLLTMGVFAKGSYCPRALVQLEPGQTLDLGDVAVVAFREIKGRCENLGGKGDRLVVQATSLDTPAHPALRPEAQSAQVAEDGTFTLRLPDGRYFVRATGAGGATTTLDTKALGSELLILRLVKEAGIRLDVQTRGELLELAIVGPDGRALWRRWLKDGWKFPINALPGDYRIELKDRTGKVTTRQLHLGAEGVDLRIP